MPVRGSMRTGSGARNSSPNSHNMWEMERRYSVPAQEHSSIVGSDTKMHKRSQTSSGHHSGTLPNSSMLHSSLAPSASEDLHAWSIYRLSTFVLFVFFVFSITFGINSEFGMTPLHFTTFAKLLFNSTVQ